MIDRWVLNASPIICLARAGYHKLLKDLPEQVVVPEAVIAEVNAGPQDDPAQGIFAGGFCEIISVTALPAVLAWDLGAGETAVLSFVMANPGWQAIVDDRAARKCARALGIPVKGTLSIVFTAKKQGLIPSAAEVLRALQAAGLWLDDAMIRQALQDIVGEKW